MNSYPPELLAQLAPVMFVAGLDPPPSSPEGPQSPPATPKSPQPQQDPFTVLAYRLREAFLSQRNPSIWAPEKSKTFQILPVDKAVRFPPRKLQPPADDPPNTTAHSPLSPLTPSSPLFPDGLIAPIWIRKHTTLVPSVFVLFLRLFELPPHVPRSPLDPPDLDREKEREQEERRRDAELSAEIAQRKKITNERGIKLTVVLMASRRMLDDPSLDARLTYIRRQSGLDSRAALFVLSPVSVAELSDFVRSLQDALYESAVEYYTTHSKRVRRKRNRHSQASVSYNLANPNAMRLRPEGWTVRYEYKMACFAEFRGEDEVALKHYQDAYAMLVIMFGSTAILPPRTKRWAEAKVLADCINVKVCKLYLYNNEHALALSYHSTHMRRFGDFSRGWGIGEETFEFWSWMARQHRILAELLEQGTRSMLTIPSHRPSPAPSSTAATAAAPASGAQPPRGVLEMDSMRSLGLNPSHALQHPGFYYYMAARCTEKRRERYLALIEAESQQGSTLAPGYANEKKVDHLTIILELYTKSYELFKKHSPINSQNLNQGRLTLWIAYRIAQTYYESEKFDMAVRFFERIAKTYRREKWGSMLRPLLSTWYACAQQLGAVEISVKLLIEMLGHGTTNEAEESGAEALLKTLKSTTPSNDEPLVVDLSESEPIFDSMVIFWTPEVKVGEAAAFQLSLTAPSVDISALPISSLAIHFTEDFAPLIVRHINSDSVAEASIRRVDLGHVSAFGDKTKDVQTDLRWTSGSKIVFAGTMSSDTPTLMNISKVVLMLKENSWNIEIPFDAFTSREGSIPVVRWLCSLDPVQYFPIAREIYSSATVRPRPHQLLVSLSHHAPAFLDEKYPILIDVANADDRDMDVAVDVLLQPTDIDHAVNHIVFDGESSSGLIKGISFGVVPPGVNVLKTLYLFNTGSAGDRILDISIQSRTMPKPSSSGSASESRDSQSYSSDISETLQTLTVPTVTPITISYDVGYRRVLAERPGLANLASFDSEFWDDGEGGEALVSARMETMGPYSLRIESVKLIRHDGEHARVVDSAIDHDDGESFPTEYLPGDEFSDICRITLAPDDEHDYASQSIPGPGQYEIIWRRILPNGEQLPTSTSRFALPSLRPPSDGLVALMSVPPAAKLHVPICMSVKIRNLHPSRSANITVQLEPDPSDAFVVSGLRSGRVPILLPGGEEQLMWRLIPVECGYVRLPNIKIMDRRTISAGEVELEGEAVKVVDVRWDRRVAEESKREDVTDARRSFESSAGVGPPIAGGVTTILVLP